MKRSLILTVVLVALGAVGIGWALPLIDSQSDNVQFEETVLFGDKSVAEGLTVDIDYTYGTSVRWNTVCKPGLNTDISTKFTYSEKIDTSSQYYKSRNEVRYGGVDFSIYEDAGASFSQDTGMDMDFLSTEGIDPEIVSMEPLLADVASRTPAGDTRTEEVYLKDYFDYYPLTVSLDLPAYFETETGNPFLTSSGFGADGLYGEIGDFFQIPVKENHRVKVTINKNSAGKIFEIYIINIDSEGQEHGGLYIDFSTDSVITEEGCYFTFASSGGYKHGDKPDTSRVKGGNGVYFLPFKEKAGKSGKHVDVSGLDNVHPLKEEVAVRTLDGLDKNGNMRMLTEEEDGFWLTVLEGRTGAEIQRLFLCKNKSTDGYFKAWFQEDYFAAVIDEDKLYVVSADSDGIYKIEMTTTILEKDRVWNEVYRPAMHWDGERLAAGFFTEGEDDVTAMSPCSFQLSVYGRDGSRYGGFYKCSFDDPALRGRCQPQNYTKNEAMVIR